MMSNLHYALLILIKVIGEILLVHFTEYKYKNTFSSKGDVSKDKTYSNSIKSSSSAYSITAYATEFFRT